MTARRAAATACAVALLSLAAGCGAPAARFVGAPPASSAPPGPPPSPTAAPSPAASGALVPAGVTAGIAVFDRQTGAFTEQRNVTQRFRSASLVKLLIALDYLWNRGPGYAVAAADRDRFDLMLRSSDDDAASYFWKLDGSGAIVTRMVGRLSLQDTTPPPANRTGWGSTALSAADLVRVYRYLLDQAPGPVRDAVLGDLRRSTRCGTDGFDQSFGIPSAFSRPWAVKQGWYEFGGKPPTRCVETAAAPAGPLADPLPPAGPAGPPAWPVAVRAPVDVDWTGEVLHTTGTVGAGDRAIVVVLTVQRHGTPFRTASAALTRLAGSLRVPRT
jgi:hypothetical protein